MKEPFVDMRPFTPSDLSPGDWIKFCDAQSNAIHYAEIRALYPFEKEPIAATTHGQVRLSAILGVRRGRPERVIDESTDRPITYIDPTCSLCGLPQGFTR